MMTVSIDNSFEEFCSKVGFHVSGYKPSGTLQKWTRN